MCRQRRFNAKRKKNFPARKSKNILGATRVLMILSLNDDIVYFHNKHIVVVLETAEPAKRIRRLWSNWRCECVNSCKIAKLLVVPVHRYHTFSVSFNVFGMIIYSRGDHILCSVGLELELIISTEASSQLTCERDVMPSEMWKKFQLCCVLSWDWAYWRPTNMISLKLMKFEECNASRSLIIVLLTN